MTEPDDSARAILAEQQTYYRERAPEYDEFVLRRGRYDEGSEHNERWFAEADEVRSALAAFMPRGDVLELAAGTGWWTPELVKHARRVTALDGSPEALALNRQRVPPGAAIDYVVDDIFTWTPDRAYDAVFFGFWLSHVPPALFETFWARVASFLKPGGRAFFVDSFQASTADVRAQPHRSEISVRRLNDGREYRIVKIFYDAATLAERLGALGWDADLVSTATYFVYGSASPR
jgi:demethylmenaquinone methyltransferase/2-methoxy-6-polyprenyl-1,4-benzoquinol methylase